MTTVVKMNKYKFHMKICVKRYFLLIKANFLKRLITFVSYFIGTNVHSYVSSNLSNKVTFIKLKLSCSKTNMYTPIYIHTYIYIYILFRILRNYRVLDAALPISKSIKYLTSVIPNIFQMFAN